MPIRGIRGATVPPPNTPEAIHAATRELLLALVDANDFDLDDIASIIFTVTPDLTAEEPARPPANWAGRTPPWSARRKCPCPAGCSAASACSSIGTPTSARTRFAMSTYTLPLQLRPDRVANAARG